VAGYAVDPGELRRGDAAVADSCAQARAAIERLQASADDVFADGWQGPAADGFRHGWRQWLAGAHDMLAALEAMADLLGAAAGGYTAAEADVRADVVRAPV
jgi:WXG100 family type VII secretion target